jgi:hypothetical protein
MKPFLVALLLAISSMQVCAQPAAVIEGVQTPAWLEEAAHAIRDKLRDAGYPAEVARRKEADKVVYHVRIRHLPSREEAQALANQLKGKFP